MSLTHPDACREHSETSVHQSNNGDRTTGPSAPAEAATAPSLRAVHTTNFPAILRQLGASLLVTTYQAGKLVMVREEGDHLNAHFRVFQAPMGLAVGGTRLAVGTTLQVWEYVDVPAAAAKLDPPGKHDCAGDIRRDGPAGPAVPGADQRRRHAARELVRGAERGTGRSAGGAAGTGHRCPSLGTGW
jgi:hypothetical protein